MCRQMHFPPSAKPLRGSVIHCCCPPSPRGNLLPSKNKSPHPSFHCHDALSLSRLAAVANHAEACHSTHSLLFPCQASEIHGTVGWYHHSRGSQGRRPLSYLKVGDCFLPSSSVAVVGQKARENLYRCSLLCCLPRSLRCWPPQATPLASVAMSAS